MELEALTPMLRTWDLPGSIAFYTEVVGLKCEAYDQESNWACLAKSCCASLSPVQGWPSESSAR